MESEQIMSEAIARAVAEATRIAIQTMAEAQVERMHDGSGPKVGSPTMKQLTFNWNAQDKYSELKTFRLEVNNILSTNNTPQADKLVLVKNWLGSKGLQYLETLTAAEKETCNTLEGLFETLSDKFKPQYNEMMKLLLFRKLYCHDDENVDEWMGKLHVAAVECNYQEVDRQLKEQFIHWPNDKHMLEEIIKELTASNNDDHITSGGVLAWAKWVEVQRAQTAVLNTLTESRQFDKVKILKNKTKEDTARAPSNWTMQWQLCRYYGGKHQLRQCSVYGKMCVGCGKVGHFKKVCHSKRSRAINNMEQEMSQEYSEGEIETVSINSVHMNTNQSMLTAKLEMHTGDNKLTVPYKIDTGSDGNIMPWYIF